MEKQELIEYILKSDIFNKWHWFSYHFKFYEHEREHNFAKSVIDACLECEKYISGFATDMIDNLSYLSGKERYEPHYEQLMQRLAEILIIKQIVTYNWPEGTSFLWEPTSESSNKNPELVIKLDNVRIGIEVKSPSLLKHERQRASSNYQLTERNHIMKEWVEKSYGKENIVLPRDNVIKDFLYSANEKFAGFKKNDDNFYGILVIVWDDYIYEPITSLISQSSGLFTDKSFAKDEEDNILRFNNVEGVVLVRHIHQFQNAAAEKPLIDHRKHALDYGKLGQFPFKAYIPNPYGKEMPNIILNCLQANIPDIAWGAEYMPSNGVGWLKL